MKKKAQKKGKAVMKVQIEENVAFDNLVNSYLSDFIFEGLNGSVDGKDAPVTDINDFKKKTLKKAADTVNKTDPNKFKKAVDDAAAIGAKLSV